MILKFSSYFLKIYPVNKYVTDLKQSCRLEREDFNRCCDIHSFQFFLCLIIFGTSECHVFVFPKNFGITFSFGCFCFLFLYNIFFLFCITFSFYFGITFYFGIEFIF